MKKEGETPICPPLFLPAEGNPAGKIPTDPLGSYTGVPKEKWEKPVQDADDL